MCIAGTCLGVLVICGQGKKTGALNVVTALLLFFDVAFKIGATVGFEAWEQFTRRRRSRLEVTRREVGRQGLEVQRFPVLDAPSVESAIPPPALPPPLVQDMVPQRQELAVARETEEESEVGGSASGSSGWVDIDSSSESLSESDAEPDGVQTSERRQANEGGERGRSQVVPVLEGGSLSAASGFDIETPVEDDV